MNCTNCGNELEEGCKFCIACGSPVAVATPEVKVEQPTPKQEVVVDKPLVEAPRVEQVRNPQPNAEASYNGLAIAGFIVSIVAFISFFGKMIFGMAGLALSIIGLIQLMKNKQKGQVLAIVGIVLASLALLYSIISGFASCINMFT